MTDQAISVTGARRAVAPHPDPAADGGFPAGFVWGAATSAYQIEGAAREDGRGPSIWDTFALVPGAVRDGDTGDVAADHYHRYRQDVALMADLGLHAYRFSVAWPRVQPAGSGPVNQAGLDFYRRLVDCLLEHGIDPWPVLYHWDLPQPLQDAGGWAARDTANRFADYAAAVYEALHDRARHWTTLNEPWITAFLGHAQGIHPPGLRDPQAGVQAAHHLLLAHGRATAAMRARSDHNEIGITLNLAPVSPATPDPADADAARRIDGLLNRQWLDALLLGRYPADVLRDLGEVVGLGHIRPGDLDQIAVPVEFLGINYYSSNHVAAGPGGRVAGEPRAASPWVGAEDVRFVASGRPTTAMGWEVDADGLADLLRRLDRDYPGLPLVITENGAAYPDVEGPDGQVHDLDRIDYLDAHLRAAHRAIEQGVNLRGFFAWSLMDNFEWTEGYSKCFGLVHVDFATQRRTWKDSAYWYRDTIARNGLAKPSQR